MSIIRHDFGSCADGPVSLYELSNPRGTRACVSTWGATLTRLCFRDRLGETGDVVLGFDRLEPYLAAHPYFGGTIGRYANRVAGARFELDGHAHRLSANDGANHLHGGARGFDRHMWLASPEPGEGLTLQLHSPDGDQGFPGALDVSVQWLLGDDDVLTLEYDATCTAPTVVNLTNHAYFNLGAGPDVLWHELQVMADAYLLVYEHLLVTGEVASVPGTAMDLRNPTRLSLALARDDLQVRRAGGFDHCWALRPAASFAAQLHDPASGRELTLVTDQPGLQVYTGNQLDGRLQERRGACGRHAGLCLEPQHFPDAPNRSGFPTTRLDPGQRYRQRSQWHLAVRE